jgi:hypothetical protein
MIKHKFSPAERFAVYVTHGERCYLCDAPLDLKTLEVDHILPESLESEPDRLADVLQEFGLPENFSLNSFANWMPACRRCNGKKSDLVFKATPIIQLMLQRAIEKAPKAEALARETIGRVKITKALTILEVANENGELSPADRAALMPLVLFQEQHREPERTTEPVRLAPNYTVYLEIEFTGGPLDKKILTSGKSPELDTQKASLILRVVGSFIASAEKENWKPAYWLRWRQPCEEVVALAKSEKWSQEDYNKRMKYHIYDVMDYVETEDTVRFKATYQGIE